MLYFYTEAEERQLEDIIKGIRNMPFAGFAVTKPNKVEILKSVDTKTSDNYVVYPCNKVSYFDILNAIHTGCVCKC